MEKSKIAAKPVFITGAAVFCTFLWGSAFPAVKAGYALFGLETDDVAGKLVFAGIRFFAAGLLTLLFLWITKKRLILPGRREAGPVLLVGLVQTALEYACFYIGLSHTTGVNGSVLNASSAFFAVLFAHLFLKGDRLTPGKGIGCLIGFLGILVMNVGGFLRDGVAFHVLGDGMILLAAASFAAGTLLGKKVSGRMEPALLTGCQLTAGGLALLLLGLVLGGRLPVINSKGLLLLAYMALLSAAAFSVWAFLLKYNPLSRISVYQFLTPVFGVLLSGFFLGERVLSAANLISMLLVCIGVYVVNREKSTGTSRPAEP